MRSLLVLLTGVAATTTVNVLLRESSVGGGDTRGSTAAATRGIDREIERSDVAGTLLGTRGTEQSASCVRRGTGRRLAVSRPRALCVPYRNEQARAHTHRYADTRAPHTRRDTHKLTHAHRVGITVVVDIYSGRQWGGKKKAKRRSPP